jgi:glycogen operon protein
MQRLSISLAKDASLNAMLLILNGREATKLVTLPFHHGVLSYELVWDSSDDLPPQETTSLAPGDELEVGPASTVLLRVVTG